MGEPSVQAQAQSQQLSPAQKHALVRDGFVHLPGVVPAELVRAARRLINSSLGHSGVDAAKIVQFQSQSWVPSLREHHVITDLFNRSSVSHILRNALGGAPDAFAAVTSAQIALRWPLTAAAAAEVEAQPEALRWGGHLDGLHTPTNGVPKGVLGTFTCLVGVALSAQQTPFAGNLGLLAGGHRLVETFFQQQRSSGEGTLGPGGSEWALTEDGVPTDYIPPPVRLALAGSRGSVRRDGRVHPQPVQVMMQPGDAVFVHCLTPHGNVPNLSADTRYMIYFRVRHKDHQKNGGGGLGTMLTSCWHEWPGIRDEALTDVEGAGAEGSCRNAARL
jgi:hypothetical protein